MALFPAILNHRGHRGTQGYLTTPNALPVVLCKLCVLRIDRHVVAVRDAEIRVEALARRQELGRVAEVQLCGPQRQPGASRLVRGASAVAGQALTFSQFAPFARPALVNGAAGLVTTPGGRPLSVMGFTVVRGKITEIDILADPERLRLLDLAFLDD